MVVVRSAASAFR